VPLTGCRSVVVKFKLLLGGWGVHA
jgi:hypothetical protein